MIPDNALPAIFLRCHILVITFVIKMNQLHDYAADLPLFCAMTNFYFLYHNFL